MSRPLQEHEALHIVEAQAPDRDVVIALWRRAGLTRPWNDPDADFDLALGHEGSRVLVARERDLAVGTVMVGFDGHRGWIYYLAVDEPYRRTGIARKLMRACEEWLTARGCPKAQLMVRLENEAAIGFYAALGYEKQDVVTLGRRLQAR